MALSSRQNFKHGARFDRPILTGPRALGGAVPDCPLEIINQIEGPVCWCDFTAPGMVGTHAGAGSDSGWTLSAIGGGSVSVNEFNLDKGAVRFTYGTTNARGGNFQNTTGGTVGGLWGYWVAQDTSEYVWIFNGDFAAVATSTYLLGFAATDTATLTTAGARDVATPGGVYFHLAGGGITAVSQRGAAGSEVTVDTGITTGDGADFVLAIRVVYDDVSDDDNNGYAEFFVGTNFGNTVKKATIQNNLPSNAGAIHQTFAGVSGGSLCRIQADAVGYFTRRILGG